MTPRNVALCITDLEIGGAERCLVELALRLDRSRFRPVVYSLAPRPQGDQAQLADRLGQSGTPTHFFDARGAQDVFRIVRSLKQQLVTHPPQILQSFLFHANIVGRIAARRAGVPHVVSGIRVAEREQSWHVWVDRRTSGMVDRYVCVSKSVADFSRTIGRLPPEKLLVIPNGVDVEAYPARPANLEKLGIPASGRVVTFVGRLERQKRLSWLLETAALWLERLPDCHLLLVGKGAERETLQQKCDDLRISERVHFAGWRSDVPEILAASRVLVLSSSWEGMPNVVLEAAASGLPVVSTRVEGVEELLGPAAGDQVVAQGDAQAFAEKVVRFVAQPEIATQIGRENRRRVESMFGLDAMVGAYQSLWESLLAV